MNNIAPKLSAKEYESNFAELKPALTDIAAHAEANRCLYCFDSPCMTACPTHIDISTFIKKIATGNMKGSAKTILSSNWVALTCAKACPVDVLCEGACVYNDKGEKPIQIGRLQRHVMDWYVENGMPQLFTPAPKNGMSVGVIGAGPAGLACAAELSILGFDVTIYEAHKIPGGLDTHGIAPYKMKQQDSLNEVKMIKKLGVKTKTGALIGKTISISKLEKLHDAIFIGTGLPKPTELKIPGENLAGVFNALDFVEDVTKRNWKSVKVGKRVAVIGAGNTAIDAATEARRLGAIEVYMIYRRGREQMSAYDFEYELAKSDGIKFYFHSQPKRIVGKKKVEALECLETKIVDGKLKPVPRSEFKIPVDMVIKAVGQNIDDSFLSSIPDLKIEDGMVVVDGKTYQTTNPKYFAGGDCINGGKEVVNAAYDGKRAAYGIRKWIFGE
ncbi:MAG: NAD(P)-dependent oxidoreductase [Ignavibacteriales bacterium]|nr:NAD(P)-dependent oxidoreductase [Ignavibacteriales bacterium]